MAIHRLRERITAKILSEPASPPSLLSDGIAFLVARSIAPMAGGYARLSSAVGLDFDSLELQQLPPLLRQNIDDLVAGVTRSARKVLGQCGIQDVSRVTLHESDSDLHPSHRFSGVYEDAGGCRFACKFRDAGPERFLAELLERAGIAEFIFVPDLLPLDGGGYRQAFIDRQKGASIAVDERLFHALGLFTGLMQLVGANDLHEENILFDGGRCAVVDGETIFQERLVEPRPDAPPGDRRTVLGVHLFTPHLSGPVGGEIIGFYSRLIPALAHGMADERRTSHATDAFCAGYRQAGSLESLIAAALPRQLVVRKVLMPTAAYASIMARESLECLHQPREVLSGKIAAALARLNDVYPGPIQTAAEDMAACMIPYHTSRIEHRDLRRFLGAKLEEFETDMALNEQVLREQLQACFRMGQTTFGDRPLLKGGHR